MTKSTFALLAVWVSWFLSNFAPDVQPTIRVINQEKAIQKCDSMVQSTAARMDAAIVVLDSLDPKIAYIEKVVKKSN